MPALYQVLITTGASVREMQSDLALEFRENVRLHSPEARQIGTLKGTTDDRSQRSGTDRGCYFDWAIRPS